MNGDAFKAASDKVAHFSRAPYREYDYRRSFARKIDAERSDDAEKHNEKPDELRHYADNFKISSANRPDSLALHAHSSAEQRAEDKREAYRYECDAYRHPKSAEQS